VERLRLARIEGERLRAEGATEGEVQFRFGYYTVARTGKWWWGQYAPFIPASDLGPLLELARRETTLPSDDERDVSGGHAPPAWPRHP